jgi:hypothetical protein
MYVAQKAVKSIQGKGWGSSGRQLPSYPRAERMDTLLRGADWLYMDLGSL